jgi:hypothetical protein
MDYSNDRGCEIVFLIVNVLLHLSDNNKKENDMANGREKGAAAKGKPYYYGVAGTTRPINRPK